MKRISIVQTRNGYLVVDGEIRLAEGTLDVASRSWSYNALNPAVAKLRELMESWHRPTEESEESR